MGARWTRREEAYLSDHAGDGSRAVAEALGRSTASVKVHASRLGISLRLSTICPRCGHVTHSPLVKWSGWCRKCSVDESADRAALKNRRVRAEIEEERRRILDAERRRQAIYSDTDRKKNELRRLREMRNRNET